MLVRTPPKEGILISTHNLYFDQEEKKIDMHMN